MPQEVIAAIHSIFGALPMICAGLFGLLIAGLAIGIVLRNRGQ